MTGWGLAPHAYYNNWQMLTETDENGAAQRWFIYGNYIDEVLVMVAPNEPNDYYYAHDHLFSPVALIGYDSQEEEWVVTERYEYDAYGKMTRFDPDFTEWSGTEAGNPYYFTGRRVDVLDDENLTLQYSRNRYYEYDTGQMLMHDPVNNINGRIVGYIDGMNLYEYVRSNPINKYDPYGLCPSNQDQKVDKTKVCCVYGQSEPMSGNVMKGTIKYEIISNPSLKEPMYACRCYARKIFSLVHHIAIKARYEDCGKCGPDITKQLEALEKAIDDKWKEWGEKDPEKRKKLCDALYDPSTRESAWEIFELKMSGGEGMDKHTHIRSDEDKCPSGFCEGSVTIWGTCAKNEALNYWLWGKYLSLCGFSRIYGKFGAYYHRESKKNRGIEGYAEGYVIAHYAQNLGMEHWKLDGFQSE